MMLLSALAAISSIAVQSGTVVLANRVIPINYPATGVVQVPPEVKEWDGFKAANAANADWPALFKAPGDWEPVLSKLGLLGPPAPDAKPWRVKVFILPQTDYVTGGVSYPNFGSGTPQDPTPIQQSRFRMTGEQVDSVLRSLARLPGYIRAATNGVANIAFDVSIETERVYIPGRNGSREFFTDYVASRTNDGRFVAEDKVYRGPYAATLVITGDPRLDGPLLPAARVVSIADGIQEKDGFGADDTLLAALGYAIYDRWPERNVFTPSRGASASMWVPQWDSLFPEVVWKTLPSTEELTLEQMQALYRAAPEVLSSTGSILPFPARLAPISDNVEVTIANDPDRGKVLRYAEKSASRYGGFALPYKAVDVTKTPFARFWVKSASSDPLYFGIQRSNKGSFTYTLPIPYLRDNTWKQVVIDLRTGDPPNRSLATGEFSIGAGGQTPRQQLGDIIYFLDDIEFVAQAESTPAIASNSDTFKQAATMALTELAKQPDDVLLAGLVSHSGAYPSTDETQLIELTRHVNSRIAGEATKRLAELGTATAKAEVLRLVTSSPYEYVRQLAAIEIGRFGDPQMAGILSRLFASRSWQTRLAGAQAVTMLPGDEASVISMTFLQELDPQVRLAVTRVANIKNAVVLKRLLWSTVNDPSDAVRAESAWRLMQSGQPKEVSEGYKAVRDESVAVRLDLLQRMEKNPAEAHRGALRLAVTDLSPRVRAAALRALMTQPGTVSLEEVSNTFEDKFPVVQLALLDLARAKSLTLPSNAIETMKSSIDPRVVERVRGMVR